MKPPMHLNIPEGGFIYPEQANPFDVAQHIRLRSVLSPERSRRTQGSRVEGALRSFDSACGLAQDRGERAERVEPRLRSG